MILLATAMSTIVEAQQEASGAGWHESVDFSSNLITIMEGCLTFLFAPQTSKPFKSYEI